MAYVALKPCCFAGQNFKIGEIVPDAIVHPGNANNLVKMGVIAEQRTPVEAGVEHEPVQLETMPVVIHEEKGDLALNLTAEGLQAVVDVLTGTVEDAEPIIASMAYGDALILMHAVDSRKGVKAAAEARAEALNAEESAGEQ